MQSMRNGKVKRAKDERAHEGQQNETANRGPPCVTAIPEHARNASHSAPPRHTTIVNASPITSFANNLNKFGESCQGRVLPSAKMGAAHPIPGSLARNVYSLFQAYMVKY
jgi:hypothetical protein